MARPDPPSFGRRRRSPLLLAPDLPAASSSSASQTLLQSAESRDQGTQGRSIAKSWFKLEHPLVSRFSEARALHDGSSIPRRPNAGLLLEDVKQEAADYSDIDGLNGPKLFGLAKRTSLDGGSGRRVARSALNLVKLEDDMPREGETTSTTFASLLDSAIQGLMPFPDVILQFERTCRNASESLRYAATGSIRMVEDKLM